MRKQIHWRVVLPGVVGIATLIFSGILIYPGIFRAPPLISAYTVPTPPARTGHGYTKLTFKNAEGSLVYYLYIPSNYDRRQKYPLVLLLHGGGEKSLSRNTPAQNRALILDQPYVEVWNSDYAGPDNPLIQQRWPCFVVVPQIGSTQQWVDAPVHSGSYAQTTQPTTPLLMTMQLLDALQRQYPNIDANRRYITGISSGSYGVWDAIERWPNYFAAAAPVSGAGDPTRAAVLKNLPLWAFHGAKDNTVPVSGSRQMIAAIKVTGGHPRYTEFPDLGHEIWSDVYSLKGATERVSGLYDWLFAQKR